MEFSGTWRLASCFMMPLSRKHTQTTAFRIPRRFLIDMAWFEGALVLNRALFKFGRFVRLSKFRYQRHLPLRAPSTPRTHHASPTHQVHHAFTNTSVLSMFRLARHARALPTLPQHLLLCHLGSYSVDFEFECRSGRARRACVLRFLEAAFLCAGHVTSRVFVL